MGTVTCLSSHLTSFAVLVDVAAIHDVRIILYDGKCIWVEADWWLKFLIKYIAEI